MNETTTRPDLRAYAAQLLTGTGLPARHVTAVASGEQQTTDTAGHAAADALRDGWSTAQLATAGGT